jgi:predicted NUDIX family phosphoesterase
LDLQRDTKKERGTFLLREKKLRVVCNNHLKKNYKEFRKPMKNENILVVKKEKLFAEHTVQGLTPDIQPFLKAIDNHKEFLPRAAMEEDQTYKQIIPYLLFKYSDRYFLMQRRSDSSEQRLKNKFSLGIGGHMRQEDMQNSTTIFDWAKREFNEEVCYTGDFSIKTVGVLNDDSTPVGQVHLGLVLLIEGTHENISIRSELKSGQLLTVNQCKEYYPNMETWSQIIFDTLLAPRCCTENTREPQVQL